MIKKSWQQKQDAASHTPSTFRKQREDEMTDENYRHRSRQYKKKCGISIWQQIHFSFSISLFLQINISMLHVSGRNLRHSFVRPGISSRMYLAPWEGADFILSPKQQAFIMPWTHPSRKHSPHPHRVGQLDMICAVFWLLFILFILWFRHGLAGRVSQGNLNGINIQILWLGLQWPDGACTVQTLGGNKSWGMQQGKLGFSFPLRVQYLTWRPYNERSLPKAFMAARKSSYNVIPRTEGGFLFAFPPRVKEEAHAFRTKASLNNKAKCFQRPRTSPNINEIVVRRWKRGGEESVGHEQLVNTALPSQP